MKSRKGLGLKSEEQVIKELSKINPNIDVLGEYKGRNKHIKVRCRKHNVIWEPLVDSMYKGAGCFKCRVEKYSAKRRGTSKYTEDYMRDFVKKQLKDKYTYVSFNKGEFSRQDKVMLKCDKCGSCREYYLLLVRIPPLR